MIVISGGTPQNDFWGHFDRFSGVLYRDDFYSSTHISAWAIDTKPELSEKFFYYIKIFFLKFGLSIFRRSGDIRFLVESFPLN